MAIKKTVYLAGAMSTHYANNEYHKATQWRIDIINQLLNDIADECESKWAWFDPTLNSEGNFGTVTNATILKQNIFYLDKSDIMIVNLDQLEHSPGTLFEIYYFGLQGKPVIAFGDSEWIKSPHISEYITCVIDRDSIINHLNAVYYQ